MVELPELPERHLGHLQQMVVGEHEMLQAPGQGGDAVRHQGGDACHRKMFVGSYSSVAYP